MVTETRLNQVISMSRELGLPENDLAIFGEGNTSVLAEEANRFYVKVSGSMLRTIDEEGFALLDREATVRLLDGKLESDQEILDALRDCRVDGGTRYPSVETMMHAFLLGIPGVTFVGHTHPTSLNAILSSVRAEELVKMRFFPEQVVCCGASPVYVPYTDPGLPLARKVRDAVNAWMDVNQMAPRSILLQNHGLFALGATAKEVLSCTLMWSKTARVILGALACGGVNALPQSQVERLATRPAEKYREGVIFGK